jgi:hypothetical protein
VSRRNRNPLTRGPDELATSFACLPASVALATPIGAHRVGTRLGDAAFRLHLVCAGCGHGSRRDDRTAGAQQGRGCDPLARGGRGCRRNRSPPSGPHPNRRRGGPDRAAQQSWSTGSIRRARHR